MRRADGKRSGCGRRIQVGGAPQRTSQDGIDQATLTFAGERHSFEDGRVAWCSQDEELKKTEPQEIARTGVNARLPKQADPEIEYREIAQHAIKQLGREMPIGGGYRALNQQIPENCVSELPAAAPSVERG